jgi:hypothetical protein
VFLLFHVVRRWMPAAPFPGELNASAPNKAAVSREDLGADTMEGLPVRGSRVTETYEPGALGSNRALTIVTENWYSDDLKINLLTERTDPRFGVQTVRVTNLVRAEPEASTFALPADYRVVNETPAQQNGNDSLGFPDSDLPSSPGVARAGVNGIGIPVCLYCPVPHYIDKARAAKLSGSVVLQALITADGRAENISGALLAQPFASVKIFLAARGRVAQLGERLVRNEEAGGSNPLSSTKLFNNLASLPELHELPKLPNFGPWQLKTKPDSLRPHQTEITVLGQFHVTLTYVLRCVS